MSDVSRIGQIGGDLVVTDTSTGERIKVEIKTARPDIKGRYQFCTRKAGRTDTSKSDFVLLICIDNHGKHYYYMIPSYSASKKNLTISSHPTRYRGKYSAYRIRSKILSFEAATDIASMAVLQ